jgi:Uma2 family endonuclease
LGEEVIMARSMSPEPLLSLERYMALPEGDGKVELVRGSLVREPPPAPLHGAVQARLVRFLGDVVEARELGVVVVEAGFLLRRDPDTVRIPDVAFVGRDRLPPDPYGQPLWELAPDLAVEVVSPSNRATELNARVLDYLDTGAALVWLVDPAARTVVVHEPGGIARVLRDGDTLTGGNVAPGFSVPVARLFALP